MSWFEIRFQIPRAKLADVENQLEALSALSISLEDAGDQPLLEPAPGETPIWDEVTVVALFDKSSDTDLVNAALSHHLPLEHWQVKTIEDQDWERAWMDQFEPIRFGQHLWICPSWHEPPDPSATNLILDPGLAFGSGTHPTTALCLKWLDAHPPKNKRVIDYGCGSGVLAVSALLLGANEVTGVDIDPQALQASRDNAEKNNIPESDLRLYTPDTVPDKPADLLLANILSGPLISLAPTLADHIKKEGDIVLSGILDDQVQAVADAYKPWFDIISVSNHDGWACLTGKKRNE